MTGERAREGARRDGQRPCGRDARAPGNAGAADVAIAALERDARAPGKTPLTPRLVRLHFYFQAQMAGVFADAAGGGFGEAFGLGGADGDGDGDFGAVGV